MPENFADLIEDNISDSKNRMLMERPSVDKIKNYLESTTFESS